MAMSVTDASRPFSGTELFSAFRLVMPEAEAAKHAQQWSSPASGLAEFGSPAENEVCVVFSDDVLLLLSLVSDELNEKVEAYRAELGPGPDILDDSQWRERRNEIREALRKDGKLPP